MRQAVYFFKEEDFQQVENLQLLIEVSDEFYGFAAFDAKEKKVKAWVLYQTVATLSISEAELLQIKKQQAWLNFRYTKTTIVDCDARNTLLPQVLYSEGNNACQIMYGKKPADIILKDYLPAADAVNIFSVADEMYHLFQANFENTIWCHKQSLLLKQSASNNASLTITIKFHSIFIAAAQHNKWVLLQRKQYQTPEDVLYHILNTIKHLGFDEKKTTVLLEGMAEENSALAALLRQYLYIMQWNTNLEFIYPLEASSISKHTLALTDRLLTCVL